MDEVAAVKRRALWRVRLAWCFAAASWVPELCVLWPGRPYVADLVAQLAMQVGLLICLSGGGLLLLRWRRQAGVTVLGGLVAIMLCMFAAWRGAPDSTGMSGPGGLVRVRVVSYNAHSNISAGDPEFARWLGLQDADLVCVVDPPTDFPNDNPAIKAAYPFAAAPQYGMDWPVILLSRTPIEFTELVPYAEPTKFSIPARRTLRVTVDDGGEVLFTAMYPRSPRNYTYWKQSVASVGVDAEVIRRWLNTRPPDGPPLIVAGDFNSTPTGRTHAIMRSSGLKVWSPAFGAGTFPAWVSPWLSLPLDRVWISQDALISDWRIGPRLRSDHRPIVIDFAVKRTRKQP